MKLKPPAPAAPIPAIAVLALNSKACPPGVIARATRANIINIFLPDPPPPPQILGTICIVSPSLRCLISSISSVISFKLSSTKENDSSDSPEPICIIYLENLGCTPLR